MTTRRRRAAGREPLPHALILAALSALFALGCALTSKSDPIVPRYFTPERAGDVDRAAAALHRARRGAAARPRDHASHLDERLVYRDSDYELGYYQERRWTEAPDEYLKRRLARALFEERGLRRVVGGAAATLDVELIAFDEIRAPKRVARVQVIVRLLGPAPRALGGDVDGGSAAGRGAPRTRRSSGSARRCGRWSSASWTAW